MYLKKKSVLDVTAGTKSCSMYSHHIQQGQNQPGKVANPARGQLNRGFFFSPAPFAPENLVSRDGFGSPVPRQPAHHLHTQAESGVYVLLFVY